MIVASSLLFQLIIFACLIIIYGNNEDNGYGRVGIGAPLLGGGGQEVVGGGVRMVDSLNPLQCNIPPILHPPPTLESTSPPSPILTIAKEEQGELIS